MKCSRCNTGELFRYLQVETKYRLREQPNGDIAIDFMHCGQEVLRNDVKCDNCNALFKWGEANRVHEKISLPLDVYDKITTRQDIELAGVAEKITYKTVDGVDWVVIHLMREAE